jgi:hypothetical protein
VAGPVTLEILDARGALARRFASDDPVEPLDSTTNFPAWWIRPPQRLSAEAGAHRFVWDLHYPLPPAIGHSYPIAAILRDTPREPVGPWVLPGSYTVRLTAGGVALTQPLAVRMDPRVTTPPAAWARMFALSSRVVAAMRADSALLAEVQGLRRASGAAAGAAAPAATPGAPGRPSADSLAALERDLRRLNSQLTGLLGLIEDADAAPTTQAVRAVGELERAVEAARARVRATGAGSREPGAGSR